MSAYSTVHQLGCRAYIMIIAMWAVFVALFVDCHILAESLLTLFANERHLRRPRKWMCLCLGVTFRTVEPLFATGGADRHLGIQDVFANELIPWSKVIKYLMTWNTHHIVSLSCAGVRVSSGRKWPAHRAANGHYVIPILVHSSLVPLALRGQGSRSKTLRGLISCIHMQPLQKMR
jgi:hypothetical protein